MIPSIERRSWRALVSVLLVVLTVAVPVGASAAVQDTVEEAARRVSNLSSIRDGLLQRRAGAELAWQERLLAVAWRAGLDGGVTAAAKALAAGDPVAEALAGRLDQLDSWIGDLSALIDIEDGAVAAALAEGTRIGPLPEPVERWRPLVEAAFPSSRVNEALLVIACESEGDPEARNRRSGASGLFQFLRGTWRHAAAQAGLEGASPYDPTANIVAAAWLVTASEASGIGPWAHWSCRP